MQYSHQLPPTHTVEILDNEGQVVTDFAGQLRSRTLPRGIYHAYVKKNETTQRKYYVLVLLGVVAEYCIRDDIMDARTSAGTIKLAPIVDGST